MTDTLTTPEPTTGTVLVRVYEKDHCMQCTLTKRKLDALGVPYVTEDATDPNTTEALKALGHLAAPVVVVGTESWAGFQPERITELAARINEEKNA